MIFSKHKNSASAFRRILGMTQEQAGALLECGKSNIANMESEKGKPSADYRRILNLSPLEDSGKLTDYGKRLFYNKNISYRPYDKNKPVRKGSLKEIDLSPVKINQSYITENASSLPIYSDPDFHTDMFVWETHKAYPEINIDENETVLIMPSLSYTDGKYVVYKQFSDTYEAGQIEKNSTVLIPADGSKDPICRSDVRILGYLIKCL